MNVTHSVSRLPAKSAMHWVGVPNVMMLDSVMPESSSWPPIRGDWSTRAKVAYSA